MQDTVIVLNHFAYQLRIDIDCPTKFTTDFIAFISHFKIANYLGKIETAPKSGKLHFQSIIWTDVKLNNLPTYRNWWKPRASKTQQSVSFTSAKKIINLASYTQKDDGEVITNLSSDQLLLVPQWDVHGAKKSLREKFRHLVKIGITHDMRGGEWNVSDSQGNYPADRFYSMLNDMYILVYDTPCLHRNTYISLAYRHGIISKSQIFEQLRLPSHSNF